MYNSTSNFAQKHGGKMNKENSALLMFGSLILTLISAGVLLCVTSTIATIAFLLGATVHIYACCEHRAAHYHRRMYDAKW